MYIILNIIASLIILETFDIILKNWQRKIINIFLKIFEIVFFIFNIML